MIVLKASRNICMRLQKKPRGTEGLRAMSTLRCIKVCSFLTNVLPIYVIALLFSHLIQLRVRLLKMLHDTDLLAILIRATKGKEKTIAR